MIPNYRRKRNADDAVGSDFELLMSNRKDANLQITENLTRNPQAQVVFTPDTTVAGANAFLNSEDLHPFVKYGIPIGAMFLLGLFLYATFSKRWNRKAAMMTISAESMKLNTTTSIDTIAENVSCQISGAENSVLRHIEEHFGKTRDAIINDIPIANEEELMLGLKKTIAQQEMKLKGNIRKRFELTKSSITSEAQDEFTAAEDVFRNHGINKSEHASLIQPEDLKQKLSNIQNNISAIIRRKISDSSDALLPSTQKEVLHTTDLLKNIIPNNLQESHQDWKKTRSRLKQMEETLIKDVKKILISTEENILEYIQNRLNEIEQASESEKQIEIYQNDMEVNIKQPGRQSPNETIDVVQNIHEKKPEYEKSMGKIGTYSEGVSNDENIRADGMNQNQIQEIYICSKCAASKNNSDEFNRTVAIAINEKYDKMEEVNLKTENNNTIPTDAIIEEYREKTDREPENISKNKEPKAVSGLNVDEILEIPERDDKRTNYSVREQAENSIKLWLARFKQAVPHLPDNIQASKKYDKIEKSIVQKTTEVSIDATEKHVVINMDEINNKTELQDDTHKGNHSTNNQVLSFNKKETIEVEIHEQPAENKDKGLEAITSFPTTLLDIDNGFLEAGGLQKIEESNFIKEQLKQAEENATNNERFKSYLNHKKEKIIKIMISEHVSDDEVEVKENKLEEKLLAPDDEFLESDAIKVVKEQDFDVQTFAKPEETAENYESLKSEIEEKKNKTIRYEYEPNASEKNEEFSKLNRDGPSTSQGGTKELKVRTNQAEENAAKYKQFKSELEKQGNQLDQDNIKDVPTEIIESRNTEVETKEYGNSADIPRKWLRIDETFNEGIETWPTHLPKILGHPVVEETNPKRMMETGDTGSAKIDTYKEWPVNEENMIKSDSPHEEIIKICHGQTFGENHHAESMINEEKSDKIIVEEICPDQYIIKDNNLKEGHDENVLIRGDQYLHNEEIDEAAKSKIFYGDRINEITEITELEEKKNREQTNKEEENGDKQDDQKNVLKTMELLDNLQEENWEFNKNIDRKESVASTISDVSTSSSDTTSNEELKKEERDTLPVLKLPNMDEKLRKKRRINRRQLKSLDSGVHHYYGEYIAIEFPINEVDEVLDKVTPIKPSTVSEQPQFISTNSQGLTNEENIRRYGGISAMQPEDVHTSERGNVDLQF